MAVKALIDTLGPECLVPSALVFGEFTSTGIYTDGTADPRASLERRAHIATTARKEMEQHMDKLRVHGAQCHAVLPSSNTLLNVGQKVFVWSERQV